MSSWIKAIVTNGNHIGKTSGFPTLNLSNPQLLIKKKTGVYSCRVKIASNIYHGVLYYGPKLVLNEKTNIVEIFVLNFDNNVYGHNVEFRLDKFIRPPKDFSTLLELKKQLVQDVMIVKKMLSDASLK